MDNPDIHNTPFFERQKVEKEKKFAEALSKVEEAHPEFFFGIGRQITEVVLWDYNRNVFTFDTELRPDIIEDCINALKNAGIYRD